MARRRGLSNQERLASFLVNVTATGAVLSTPAFVYSLQCTLNATTATGLLCIADTTAAGDVALEGAGRWDWKLGCAGVSGQTSDALIRQFMPPLYVGRSLYFANSTGINSVSIQYIPVS